MEYRQPKKLMAFFTQPLRLRIQDGARGPAHDAGRSYTDLPDADLPMMDQQAILHLQPPQQTAAQ